MHTLALPLERLPAAMAALRAATAPVFAAKEAAAARLQHQHSVLAAFRQPVGKRRPSGACANDYGVDVTPRHKIMSTTEPPVRAAGVKVADVTELVAKLKDETGVI